jgi:peptidyl-tRNA hydrolase
VLSKFNSDETEKLQKDVLPKVAELIDDFIAGSHASTSHKI